MTKRDLKKLALLGLATGLLAASQSGLYAEEQLLAKLSAGERCGCQGENKLFYSGGYSCGSSCGGGKGRVISDNYSGGHSCGGSSSSSGHSCGGGSHSSGGGHSCGGGGSSHTCSSTQWDQPQSRPSWQQNQAQQQQQQPSNWQQNQGQPQPSSWNQNQPVNTQPGKQTSARDRNYRGQIADTTVQVQTTPTNTPAEKELLPKLDTEARALFQGLSPEGKRRVLEAVKACRDSDSCSAAVKTFAQQEASRPNRSY